MMKRTHLAGLLLVAAGGLPWPGLAQEASRSFQQPRVGWIGITVDFTSTVLEGRESTVAVISQIVPGSPADVAGIRVGDTLLRLDAQPVTERTLAAFPQTLEPGDLVRLTFRREGRSRDLLVEAAPRPVPFPVMPPNLQEVVVRLDTVRGAILQNLDSLRLSIAGLRVPGLHVDTAPGQVNLRFRQLPLEGHREGDWTMVYRMLDPIRDSTASRYGAFFLSPDLAVPFESFAVRTPAADSIRERLGRVRQEVTEIRRQQLSRQLELEASLRGSAEEAIRVDQRLAALRTREEALVAEQVRLTERLQRASEHEAQRQWAEAQARYEESLARLIETQAEARRDASREREERESRSRDVQVYVRGTGGSPVIVGQSVMLGAQLAPLNPDLAAVFSVPEGVFVIQVPEGTPAWDAGLQGGDVIVRIGDETVASLSDLRFGLGAGSGPLRMRVIRKGQPLEIVVRR